MGSGEFQEPPSCSQQRGSQPLEPHRLAASSQHQEGGPSGEDCGEKPPSQTSLVLQRPPVRTPGLLFRIDCVQRQERKWMYSLLAV